MQPTDREHPDDGILLAIVHGETVGEEAREHVDACGACEMRRRELAQDDAAVAAILLALDSPANETDLQAPSTRRRARRGLGIAAAIATLAIGAAAVVIPTSPLHLTLGTPAGTKATAKGPTAPPPVQPGPLPAESVGVGMPASATLTIVFQHEQKSGDIRITRTDSGGVVLRSNGGTPAYQVAHARVTIDNARAAAEYLIAIPREVHVIRVLVGTRVLWRWPEDSTRASGGEIRLSLATAP